MRIVRWIIGGLLLLVFSAFTGIVWLAYHEDRSSVGEAPLVRADAEPYRQAPDKRGGLAVLNEGSSIVQALDRGPEPAIVERILPPPRPAPKSPADISRHQFAITPDVKPDPVRANDGDVARPTVVAREVTDGPATGAAGGGADSATLPEALASPDIVSQETLPVPADMATSDVGRADAGNVVPSVQSSPAPTSTGDVAVSPPATVRTVTLGNDELPVVDAPVRDADLPPAVDGGRRFGDEDAQGGPIIIDPTTGRDLAPSAAPSDPDLVALLAEPGPYRLQLAAFHTEEQARQAGEALQRRMEAVMPGLPLRIVRAETDKGIFYRIQTADAVGRAGADRLCQAFKSAGGDCFMMSGER